MRPRLLQLLGNPLADIEHDRTVPTLGRLQAVANALEITVRDLLQGVEPYDAPVACGCSTCDATSLRVPASLQPSAGVHQGNP